MKFAKWSTSKRDNLDVVLEVLDQVSEILGLLGQGEEQEDSHTFAAVMQGDESEGTNEEP